jgi:NADH dehydrogenase
MMSDRIVTVFGGTGFLGRHVVRCLRMHGFAVRAASRHPHSGTASGDPGLTAVRADVHDPRSIAEAVAGAWGVVNSVALYVERGRDTFQAIHVDAAREIALAARAAGVARLAHVSGIGADTHSPSLYVRKRAEGDLAVRAAFPGAIIVRPGVMFGTDSGFLVNVLGLLRRLPAYPMFGRGQTRLQPASVEDVGEAIARIMARPETQPDTYEFGGPQVFTYEDLLRTVAREAGLKPFLVPFPFVAWHALAGVAEFLPHPPVTRNQVEVMEVDTVTAPDMPGLNELGVTPQPVEDSVRKILAAET